MTNRRRRLAAEFLAAFVICLAFVSPVNAGGEQKRGRAPSEPCATATLKARKKVSRVAGQRLA